MTKPSQVPVSEDASHYGTDSVCKSCLQPLRNIKASDISHWLTRFQPAEVAPAKLSCKRKLQPTRDDDSLNGSPSFPYERSSTKKLRKSHSTPLPMYPYHYSSPSMWLVSKLEAYRRDEGLTDELSGRLEKILSDN